MFMKIIRISHFITLFLLFSLYSHSAFSQTIAAGSNFTLSICLDSTVKSWGYNYYGQLGLADTFDRHAPEQIPGLSGISAVDAGEWHALALKSNGTVWSWGNNFNGQLGTGYYINSSVPVQVFNLNNVKAIASGQNHCLALKSDSTVWDWGYNQYGQLGNGTTNLVACNCNPVAVPVSNLTHVIAIAGGGFHSLALRSDSTVWAWGRNNNGQLGDSTTLDSSIPVQIRALSGIVAISAGNTHSIALKSDGTIYVWGGNSNGQLGDSSLTDKYFPVKLNGLVNIMSISAGFNHSLALKNDSTMCSWGNNDFSQLGDNSLLDKNYPVSVQNISGISEINAGFSHSIALKNNFSVQAWGNNEHGIGDGTVVLFGCHCRMIPVQIINWCSPLGIDENNLNELLITVYPNPFISETTVSVKGNRKFNSIKIKDVLGREIMNEKLNQPIQANSGEWSFDLIGQDWTRGIYFLQLEDLDKKCFNKMIIIQ